ncbi:MAG: hypothetical protein ACOYMR_15425 [Ilumatobacteraceae bacterium]
MHTKKAKAFAFAIAATALVGAAVTAGDHASADPKQYDAPFVGVGSDTTQDIMNAFSGFENGLNYTPLQSDSATGQKQIVSWDATANGLTTTCITTRTGGPSFNRPNGSGAGRTAVLSTITSGGTTSVSNCGTGTTSASGQLSFARSSSLSGTAGTTLAYVPFARDALSFGYYRKAGAPVTSLTTTELTSIFGSATGAVVGGVRIYGCDIQLGSGTGQTWRTKVGGVSGTALGTTSVCDNAGGGLAQENDGDGLVTRGDGVDAIDPGAQVIIGFSVGGYIGKANGVARGGMPTTVGIGTISNISANNPIVGDQVTGRPNLTGDTTFYATSFGRDIYNVFPASVINSAFGNDAIKQIFKGATSQLCLATTTIQKFGFQTLGTCGDSTTLRGA